MSLLAFSMGYLVEEPTAGSRVLGERWSLTQTPWISSSTLQVYFSWYGNWCQHIRLIWRSVNPERVNPRLQKLGEWLRGHCFQEKLSLQGRPQTPLHPATAMVLLWPGDPGLLSSCNLPRLCHLAGCRVPCLRGLWLCGGGVPEFLNKHLLKPAKDCGKVAFVKLLWLGHCLLQC